MLRSINHKRWVRQPRRIVHKCRAVFDRFNEGSIKAVLTAQKACSLFGHYTLYSDHLLYALTEILPFMHPIVPREDLRELIAATDRSRLETGKEFSDEVKTVFLKAMFLADTRSIESISTEHLLEAMIVFDEATMALRALEELKVNPEHIMKALNEERFVKAVPVAPKSSKLSGGSALKKFCVNLNELAADGKVDPVVGRDEIMQRIVQILTRRSKNNPILIGEPGVGKTAIAEGLAYMIAREPGRAPYDVRDKVLYRLDIAGLMAGTKDRGGMEARVTEIVKDMKAMPDAILFIDEIHVLVARSASAPSSEGEISLVNIIKPALARGEFTCIGATTRDEFTKYFEQDPALARRFQPVWVDPPDDAATKKLLLGISHVYEDHHGCVFTREALDACVDLTTRYIPYRNHPDKAIDAMDEAGSRAVIERYESRKQDQPIIVNKSHVIKIVEEWGGVPIKVNAGVLDIETRMKTRVKGQDEAIERVSEALKRSAGGMRNPRRPTGCFLFYGPTGVGKTELARVLSREWYGGDMIRFDMSEMMEKGSVSKLLGSPPGYIGYDEPAKLVEAVKRRPHSLILFDEIEKAHPEVANVLLQAMEDGVVTDTKGFTAKLCDCIIILTSNLSRVDFGRFFRPELLNRFDDIVEFNSLEKHHIREIMNDMLINLQKRSRLEFEVTEPLKEILMEEGHERAYGARAMRRAIERLVEDPLAEFMLNNLDYTGGVIIDYNDIKLL